MALSTAQFEQDIVDELKKIIPRVYVTEVPPGVNPGYPLMVVYFGEPVRTGRGNHLTSTINDTLRGYCIVRVISTDDVSANAVKNSVKEALTGFRPTDCGEMFLSGGFSYPSAATNAQPVTYYREVGFSYLTNLTENT